MRGRHDPSLDPIAAAKNGDTDAQYELGVSIIDGMGNPPDYPEAAEWFRKAAGQGHPGAQAALGFLYHRGLGVKRDDGEAVRWLEAAAASTSPDTDAYALWRDYVARQHP